MSIGAKGRSIRVKDGKPPHQIRFAPVSRVIGHSGSAAWRQEEPISQPPREWLS
jgi:hypothetical protein